MPDDPLVAALNAVAEALTAVADAMTTLAADRKPLVADANGTVKKAAPLGGVRVGRRSIAVGDSIRVLPSKPRKRDGFEAKVLAMYDTTPVTVDVRQPSNGALRTLPIDRVAPLPRKRS